MDLNLENWPGHTELLSSIRNNATCVDAAKPTAGRFEDLMLHSNFWAARIRVKCNLDIGAALKVGGYKFEAKFYSTNPAILSGDLFNNDPNAATLLTYYAEPVRQFIEHRDSLIYKPRQMFESISGGANILDMVSNRSLDRITRTGEYTDFFGYRFSSYSTALDRVYTEIRRRDLRREDLSIDKRVFEAIIAALDSDGYDLNNPEEMLSANVIATMDDSTLAALIAYYNNGEVVLESQSSAQRYVSRPEEISAETSVYFSDQGQEGIAWNSAVNDVIEAILPEAQQNPLRISDSRKIWCVFSVRHTTGYVIDSLTVEIPVVSLVDAWVKSTIIPPRVTAEPNPDGTQSAIVYIQNVNRNWPHRMNLTVEGIDEQVWETQPLDLQDCYEQVVPLTAPIRAQNSISACPIIMIKEKATLRAKSSSVLIRSPVPLLFTGMNPDAESEFPLNHAEAFRFSDTPVSDNARIENIEAAGRNIGILRNNSDSTFGPLELATLTTVSIPSDPGPGVPVGLRLTINKRYGSASSVEVRRVNLSLVGDQATLQFHDPRLIIRNSDGLSESSIMRASTQMTEPLIMDFTDSLGINIGDLYEYQAYYINGLTRQKRLVASCRYTQVGQKKINAAGLNVRMSPVNRSGNSVNFSVTLNWNESGLTAFRNAAMMAGLTDIANSIDTNNVDSLSPFFITEINRYCCETGESDCIGYYIGTRVGVNITPSVRQRYGATNPISELNYIYKATVYISNNPNAGQSNLPITDDGSYPSGFYPTGMSVARTLPGTVLSPSKDIFNDESSAGGVLLNTLFVTIATKQGSRVPVSSLQIYIGWEIPYRSNITNVTRIMSGMSFLDSIDVDGPNIGISQLGRGVVYDLHWPESTLFDLLPRLYTLTSSALTEARWYFNVVALNRFGQPIDSVQIGRQGLPEDIIANSGLIPDATNPPPINRRVLAGERVYVPRGSNLGFGIPSDIIIDNSLENSIPRGFDPRPDPNLRTAEAKSPEFTRRITSEMNPNIQEAGD